MTTYPEEDVYRRPTCPPAEEFPVDADLAPGHRLIMRPRIYKGRVVDFALQQMARREDGDWVEVARIDCCHSTIHRHQFVADGTDIYDRRVIQQIPKDGWEVVNAAFEPAVEAMMAEWEENVRRWRDA
ncbi:DUF7718 family protein [Micromonospora sp. CA-248260]|uniref:DUF7718 family protein n=1 Tax=Micromonospora sp. CA-248260 TaxID=3239962 RepID=UPI003D9130A8